jgi:hypothetical protein
MPTDPTIQLTCPRCNHTWYEKIENLEKPDQTIFRDASPHKRTQDYRARCPQDHTYFILKVQVEEDDHA